MRPRNFFWGLLGLAAGLLLTLALAPLVGPTVLDWEKALDFSMLRANNPDATTLFDLRIPRVLLGALVGGSLAISGVSLQALLRNPLATPFTMGISGGASLGAVLAIQLGFGVGAVGFSGVSLAAAAGAAVATLIVYWLGRRKGYLETVTLLLAGVTVSFLAGAMIRFIYFIANPHQTLQITHWTMGSLDVVGMESIYSFGVLCVIGAVPIFIFSRDLNLLSVGEEEAQALGIDLHRTRALFLTATSVLTGVAVAAAGPIAFVGLIVPHALRIVAGPDNRFLVPGAAFAGAIFLVACDTIARSFPGGEIPVGIITALLGCPFFIWLLRRRKRETIL